jgi:glycosyltransferase involved in cell wall biosynthesis
LAAICIIIPAYNAETYLARTINSILAQSLADWQLIVVDDGSIDGTRQIARSYADTDTRIQVIHQPNCGTCGGARNAALPHVPSEVRYVAFLDSDDVWYPDALSCLKEAADSDPDCVGAHGWASYIDPNDQETTWPQMDAWSRNCWTVRNGRAEPIRDRTHTTYPTMVMQNCITTPGAALVRRNALQTVGPFDGRYSPADDWELWIRLARHGSFVFVDRPIVKYRVHAGGISRNETLMNEVVARVWTDTMAFELQRSDPLGIVRSAYPHLSRMTAKKRLAWARYSLRRGNLITCAKQLRHAAIAYGDALRGTPKRLSATTDA